MMEGDKVLVARRGRIEAGTFLRDSVSLTEPMCWVCLPGCKDETGVFLVYESDIKASWPAGGA